MKFVSQTKALVAVLVAYLVGAISYSVFNGDLIFTWLLLKLMCRS